MFLQMHAYLPGVVVSDVAVDGAVDAVEAEVSDGCLNCETKSMLFYQLLSM